MPWKHMGEWRYISTVLDLETRKVLISFTSRRLYPRIHRSPLLVPIEAEWAPEPVWTLWRRDNFCPCRESNPGHPSPSLYRLSHLGCSPRRKDKNCDIHKFMLMEVSSVFKQTLRWFQSSKLLLQASHAALPIEVQIKPLCCKGHKTAYPNYTVLH
jgi:hypothetical protein